MKVKKEIIIGIIMMILMGILLVPNISYAVEVSRFESKTGGTLWNNVTISRAYRECYDLRSPLAESTLGQNSLDPHLTLNKDWGAVAYLALSKYGNGTNTNTTGNVTGVQDFGINYEWTSSLKIGATSLTEPENRTDLTNKVEGEQYVEELKQDADSNIENSKGMAIAETIAKATSKTSFDSNYPCLARDQVCGFRGGGNGSYECGIGKQRTYITFRPTIWN